MHKLFKATLIVTKFSIATRGLGFVLRIILSRGLGAEILGNYQVAMSILGVLMTLISSGIPLVVSRSVSYNKSIKNDNLAYSYVSAGLIYTLSISILLTFILFLFPDLLNILFTQDIITNIVLISLPSLIFSSIYCILRSALWGEKHFFAISFTEFFEQVVRVILCLILFFTPILSGISLGEKAALSLTLACLLSAILVVIIYFKLKQKLSSPKVAFKPLIKSALPITSLRTLSSVVSSLISIIIPIMLTKYGYSSGEAMAQFGMIMGMAFPLILIPGTIIGSIAVTLVPEISSKTDNIKDKTKTQDLNGLQKHIKNGLNLSILISMFFVPAFIVLGKPICNILFGSADAGLYVQYAAILMLPMGITQMTGSILNSIGLEFKSLINYALGAIFLLLSIIILPQYIGTFSLIVGMGLMSSINAILNIRLLKKLDLLKLDFYKPLILSLIYSVITIILGFLTFSLLTKFLSLFLSTFISGILCSFIMLGLYACSNSLGINILLFIKRKKGRH